MTILNINRENTRALKWLVVEKSTGGFRLIAEARTILHRDKKHLLWNYINILADALYFDIIGNVFLYEKEGDIDYKKRYA